jgi:ABC-type branched-subunit amino acid transport system ATPase component
MADPFFEVRELTVRFDGVTALDRVSLSVSSGEIRGLIGPNGAGKTTLFRTIAGLVRPKTGSIFFGGRSILGLSPHHIVGRGVARTFQANQPFPGLTVREHLRVGADGWGRGAVGALFLRPDRTEEARLRKEADQLLEFLGLDPVADQLASELPYGLQRLTELGRALATRPRLLLLDEPAAGLRPEERRALAERLRALQGRGLTLLLVEHQMPLVMNLCHRITVLHGGRLLAEGSPEVIQQHPEVRLAYLGREAQ